jgi:hypothetical protein
MELGEEISHCIIQCYLLYFSPWFLPTIDGSHSPQIEDTHTQWVFFFFFWGGGGGVGRVVNLVAR